MLILREFPGTIYNTSREVREAWFTNQPFSVRDGRNVGRTVTFRLLEAEGIHDVYIMFHGGGRATYIS